MQFKDFFLFLCCCAATVFHIVEFRKILSRTFFAKMMKNFRENNAVMAFYSKMALEMARLSIFGANLRKFGLFGVIEEGLY